MNTRTWLYRIIGGLMLLSGIWFVDYGLGAHYARGDVLIVAATICCMGVLLMAVADMMQLVRDVRSVVERGCTTRKEELR